MAGSMVDLAVFETLQTKIDEESQIREKLKEITQVLEKQLRTSQALISRVHSTPSTELASTLNELTVLSTRQADTISQLATFANDQPYYRYNTSWSRQIQDAVAALITAQWLRDQQLPTLDQVGEAFGVPVNVKDRDEFHITIEEYLHALISVIDELARLAVNSVTLGDYERPLQISKFIKEVHSGFQLLNLKNDSLRKRSDSIKYSVKKVEDVVYDLSLRNLIPKNQEKMETS